MYGGKRELVNAKEGGYGICMLMPLLDHSNSFWMVNPGGKNTESMLFSVTVKKIGTFWTLCLFSVALVNVLGKIWAARCPKWAWRDRDGSVTDHAECMQN